MSYKDDNSPVFIREMKNRALGEINRDFILPDVYADIKRILGYKARLVPESTFADRGKVEHRGSLECKVIFVSDEGKMRCASFRDDYALTLSYDGEGSDRAFVMPVIENVSVKAANPRKISLRASVYPAARVVSVIENECDYVGDFTKEDIARLETLGKSITSADVVSFLSGVLDFGDDLVIQKDLPAAEDIVFCDLSFGTSKVKAKENSLEISGSAFVNVAYSYYDNGVEKIKLISHTVPLKDEIEMGGINESYSVFASPYLTKLTCEVAEDAMGEKRVIELDFAYEYTLFAYTKRDYTLIEDTYSCDFETELEHSSVKYPEEPYFISSDKEIESVFDTQGEKVVGAFCETRYAPEQSGEMGAKVIFTLLLENENGAFSSLSSEIVCEMSEKGDFMLYRSVASEPSIKYLDDKVIVSSDISFEGIGWKEKNVKYVSLVKKLDKNIDAKNCAYTVFYPSNDETLWDVGKKYKVPTEALMSENGIYESNLALEGAVIVPNNKRVIFEKNL